MLSRVADSIFWMNRYIERAENVARFVDVNLNVTLDLGDTLQGQWAPLISITGDDKLFHSRYGEATQENVIRFLTFDAEYSNSIYSCLRAARENARTIREIIPESMWEEINKFYWMVVGASRVDHAAHTLYEFLAQVKLSAHIFVGINDTVMSHDEGWHFARLGRLLERADKTSRILDVKYFILLPAVTEVGTPIDTLQWSALLKSTSGLQMFRKCHSRITPENVVNFLVLDREFPRAMRFCLAKAEESLHAITGSPNGTFQNLAERSLGRLRSELDYAQVDDIIGQGLHEFVDRFQNKLNAVGSAIHETFFAPRPVRGMLQRQGFQQ